MSDYKECSTNKLNNYFYTALSKIRCDKWQTQFENGFHLRMLKNHANISHEESRFLSMFVIWEWLYPHLVNPNGSSHDDEEKNIIKIINYILDEYWDNNNIKNNIFRHLRNQYTHSGKLPINRKYEGNKKLDPEDWMTKLSGNEIGEYVRFFDKLTQVVVLKTIGINAEHILGASLNRFLETGKI